MLACFPGCADRIGAVLRAEKRETFATGSGEADGQLTEVLDPAIEYDLWREMGPCPKPDVDILFMAAEDDGEIAADDPRVSRATCRCSARARSVSASTSAPCSAG